MGVYGSPQIGAYSNDNNKNNRYSVPETLDYVKWIMTPTILSMFTCGIGGLILVVVWACSNEQIARRNLMRAFLFITVLPFLILIIVAILSSTNLNVIQNFQTRPYFVK